MTNCSRNHLEKQIEVSSEIIVKSSSRSPLFYSQETSSSEDIRGRIQRFRDRLQSVKNREMNFRDNDLTPTEANWNLEATINASYAKADANFSKLSKAENELTIPITGGVINNDDLLTAYGTTKGFLANHYNSIASNYKQVLVIDINLEEETTEMARFKIITFIASAPPTPTGDNVYGDTDYWYWGNEQGRCDGSGEGVGLDAADILAEDLNLRYPLPNNHLYFTSIEAIGIQAFDYPNYDDNNFGDFQRDYLLFMSNTSSEILSATECISPEDMEWYYNNIYTITGQLKPAGKDFSHIELHDNVLIGEDIIFHDGTIYYGISVQCECDPCSPNVPEEDCPSCC